MKSLLYVFAIISILAVSNLSKASQPETPETIDTLFSCQQDDGDQWIEVGVAINDGPGLRLYVVDHNSDDSSSVLRTSKRVFRKRSEGSDHFQDTSDTVKLHITKKGEFFSGHFSMLDDGSNGIPVKDMACFPKSQISFVRRAK